MVELGLEVLRELTKLFGSEIGLIPLNSMHVGEEKSDGYGCLVLIIGINDLFDLVISI